jgi:N-methylhydantoinase B
MNVCFAGHDPRHSGSAFFYIDSTPGGWGAHEDGDGENGQMSTANGSIKLQPAEVFEAKYPIHVLEYSLRQDSEGPGRQRGGFGVRRTYELDADASLNLWLERSVTPAWGLFGGESATGPQVDISGSVDRHDLKTNRMLLKAGDKVVIQTGGGGGWGRPFERDPEAVAQDARDGSISVERARARYGVVLDGDLRVDEAATEALRSAQPAS